MKFKSTCLLFFLLILFACDKNKSMEQLPNVVIIYMDDLGYGDVSAYGATEIRTPNFDKLAEGGIRFTDGHASSSTCTPSRFALLTGEYPWRQKDVRILPGTAPLLISTDHTTLPKVFHEKGYQTGIVGKWHLGLGDGIIDWNMHISPGPNEVGFDDAYILAATQDRVPTVYIENGNVVGLDPGDPIEVSYEHNFDGEPTGRDNPELLTLMYDHGHDMSIVNGISRIGYMKGGEKAKWSDIDMADHFLRKAQDFVKSQKEKPFFLYYAMQQPHVPRTPNPRFAGVTGMGPRGDAIAEADWCVGEFLKTLEEEGILENTLIIFTSDNGPVVNDGYKDQAVELLGNHRPSGDLRGGKYSLFEAGTRVPFIVYWKGTVQPGISDALVCQVDLLSSLAELIGSETRTRDSEALTDVLLGKSSVGRESLILEASGRTAFRKGSWAVIPPYAGAPVTSNTNVETGNSPGWSLFNLNDDIGQQHNVADENPEKLQELRNEFEIIRDMKFPDTVEKNNGQ